MTGAGSAQVAYAVEDSYGTLPGTPTWIQPFVDLEVGSASLERGLTRGRQPDDPLPQHSNEGNLEGALNVSGTMTDSNFHELVFADSGTDFASTAMLAPTATWYLSSNVIGGTQERFPQGAAVESFSINYQQGEQVTVDLSMIYGAGESESLTTPSDITKPDVSDSVPWHGVSLDIDSVTVEKLQSFTLEVSNMARLRRGANQEAEDAVVGPYEPSLTVQATLTDGTNKNLAYGGSSATETVNEITESEGSVTINNATGNVASYYLNGLQPTTYDWSDLVNPDTDITDPTTFHVGFMRE